MTNQGPESTASTFIQNIDNLYNIFTNIEFCQFFLQNELL